MPDRSVPSDFDLNDIRLLLSLWKAGNMSAAARTLGLDVSTVSRRLAIAEKALGARLFIRSGARYELTDAGKTFIEQAERINDQIGTMLLTSTDAATSISGTVRITSTDFLLDYWLVKHLPGLRQLHPGLGIELIASGRNLSFTGREADLALRLQKPDNDAALLMRKFGDLDFCVYGARDYADRPELPWPEQQWISYDDSLAHTPEMRWLVASGVDLRGSLRVNTLSTMVRACIAGNGLALLPKLLGAHAGLIRLSESTMATREIWLLSHRDAASVQRFKVVSEWLQARYLRDDSALAGEMVSQG